eukprot:148124-Pelagomonas_calceolata.AAC.8
MHGLPDEGDTFDPSKHICTAGNQMCGFAEPRLRIVGAGAGLLNAFEENALDLRWICPSKTRQELMS